MARLSCIALLLGARTASATTATDTFTATLPTATETFTLPTTAATSTETYTLPTATFTLPTGGETATHTFTLPTSTATYDNKTWAPTKAPTSPTSSPSIPPSMMPSASPSGSSAPSRTPSHTGDTHAPTHGPSAHGDTSHPIMPTMSPSHVGDTSAPIMPTMAPSHFGDTRAPTGTTLVPTTLNPSMSPSKVGDTSSPVTQMPTSSISPTAMAAQITAILNQPIAIPAYGCASAADTSCTCVAKTPTTKTVQIQNFTQTIVSGGVTYVFKLDVPVAASEASDTGGSTSGCPSGGFTYGLRNSMTGAIGIVPRDRMPFDTMSFANTARRHAGVLQSGSDVGVSVCDAVDASLNCITANPTMSPVVRTPSPTKHHGGGDDDFPGWAIALCVVLPVLAIGAAVAVYFFVCNKQETESEEYSDKNAPDNADAKPGGDPQV